MPALDQCHDQVIRAFQKEGWHVDKEQYDIHTIYRSVFIDLALSRRTNGTQHQIMLSEIKCFPTDGSTTRELYGAIGQYLIYRAMTIEVGLNFPLYLAIPKSIFDTIFDPAVMRVINSDRIRLVIIDLAQERIVQWITHEKN